MSRDWKDQLKSLMTPTERLRAAVLNVGESDGIVSFADQLVEEAGIMIAPSHVFDYGNQHFRIGFGRENFGEVLEKFGDYLDG